MRQFLSRKFIAFLLALIVFTVLLIVGIRAGQPLSNMAIPLGTALTAILACYVAGNAVVAVKSNNNTVSPSEIPDDPDVKSEGLDNSDNSKPITVVQPNNNGPSIEATEAQNETKS